MPETRKQDQYKIYTLHNNVVVPIGKKDGKEVTRTDRVPVAIFDDKKTLETYQKKSEYIKPSFEVVEDWVEIKPSADNFSLPFNPAPLVSGEPNDNGTN